MTMKFKFKYAVAALLAGLSFQLLAQTAAPAKEAAPAAKKAVTKKPAAKTTASEDTKVSGSAEEVIRKTLSERLPNLPKIDEVRKTDMPGLFEVRIGGTDVVYTDASGSFLIQGNLIDTKARRNLTEERIEKLTAINFSDLPLKDAFTVVRGNGKRKVAVFEDPNCGYCKRFERDLQNVDNVTVYMFLLPILGQDSMTKSRNIWCAKDRAKAWQDFMVRDQAPEAADAKCDVTALQRNVDISRKHKITGTPTLIFADNSRVPGAIPAAQVEKFLSEVKN
jgi:thiol:disulfide interchange protein DsbC